MSYTPNHTDAQGKSAWKDYPDTSTKVFASDLNHIEDGLASTSSTADSALTKANQAFKNISAESGNTLVEKEDGLYVPSSGGGTGGTTVVANPEGDVEDTLSTIEIDGVIYDLEGSGGSSSGGGITVETIYSSDVYETTINLTKSFKNYDFIMLESYILVGVIKHRLTNTYEVSKMIVGERIGALSDSSYCWIEMTSENVLTIVDTNSTIIVDKIIGIKCISDTSSTPDFTIIDQAGSTANNKAEISTTLEKGYYLALYSNNNIAAGGVGEPTLELTGAEVISEDSTTDSLSNGETKFVYKTFKITEDSTEVIISNTGVSAQYMFNSVALIKFNKNIKSVSLIGSDMKKDSDPATLSFTDTNYGLSYCVSCYALGNAGNFDSVTFNGNSTKLLREVLVTGALITNTFSFNSTDCRSVSVSKSGGTGFQQALIALSFEFASSGGGSGSKGTSSPIVYNENTNEFGIKKDDEIYTFDTELAKGAPKVPVLTSDNGKIISTPVHQSNYIYGAYDNNNDTVWSCTDYNIEGSYLGYNFDTPVAIRSIGIAQRSSYMEENIKEFSFSYSDDGETWTESSDTFTLAENYADFKIRTFDIGDNGAHQYWRVNPKQAWNTSKLVTIDTLQFYESVNSDDWKYVSGGGSSSGGVDKDEVNSLIMAQLANYGLIEKFGDYYNLVPFMTSADTPSGKVTASSESVDSGSYPYMTFKSGLSKNGAGDGWNYGTGGTDVNAWIQYEFENPVKVKQLALQPRYSFANNYPKEFTLEGSNDGEIYTSLLSVTTEQPTDYTKLYYYDLESTGVYKYYKLNINGCYYDRIALGRIKLLGDAISSTSDTEILEGSY